MTNYRQTVRDCNNIHNVSSKKYLQTYLIFFLQHQKQTELPLNQPLRKQVGFPNGNVHGSDGGRGSRCGL